MDESSIIVRGREADILLYGEISDSGAGEQCISSREVVSRLHTLSQSCDRIRVHINSDGGEVYAGIAIFNALRSLGADVTIYTDGISASIAGIITMCGRRHYMSRYARLMIHSVSAWVNGDKDDLRDMVAEIEALEDILAKIISGRMKITPDEVKARFFDRKDHWFSAEEAVAAGLADGIYDAGGDWDGTEPDSVYQRTFTNRAAIRSQIINNMDIAQIKSKSRFENISSEEDVLRVIDELNTQIETLTRENADLAARLKATEEEDIEKILAAAVECGKITEGEKEDYRQLLYSNRLSAEKIISSLRPARSLRNDLQGGQRGESAGAWDLRQEEIRRNRAARTARM